jgi:hypothetical protein
LFAYLTQIHSPAAAVKSISALRRTFWLRTTPNLPDGWRLELRDDGTTVIVMPDGNLVDPARIYLRAPGMFDPTPIALETAEALGREEELPYLTLPAEPAPLPKPEEPAPESTPMPTPPEPDSSDADQGTPTAPTAPAPAPATPKAIGKPRRRRHGVWDWWGLQADLQKQKPPLEFNTEGNFEDWCAANVQRLDNKKRVEDPGPKATRKAIADFGLRRFVKILGS